jgi:hypothetical protein
MGDDPRLAAPAVPPAAWVPAAGLLLLLGATLGTALDAIHTVTRTTEYARPISSAAWAFAWWTPPLFAGAGLAIGIGRPVADRLLARRGPLPSAGAVALAMGIFVLAYALSGTLPGGNVARAVALGACFAAAYATGSVSVGALARRLVARP